MRRNANIRIKSCSVEVYGVIHVYTSIGLETSFDLSQDPLDLIFNNSLLSVDLI